MNFPLSSIQIIAFVALLLSCTKNNIAVSPVTTYPVPEVYKKIYGASSITSDGSFITIKTQDVPDHESVYYATTNPLYKDFSGTTYGGTTFTKNPNTIVAQNYTFIIPLNPVVATNHQPTNLGAIGVAINGVVFFNQYNGSNRPLSNETASFDKYYGHPAPTNEYHYHVEPIYLTNVKFSRSVLVGFLLDGFPVYGPIENGALVTNTQLDAYHGHTSATTDYPNGIYHYHITDADPYINGSGFYGTPGTFSK